MKRENEYFLIVYETVDDTSYQLAQSYDEALGWCKHEIERLRGFPFGDESFFAPKDVEDWLGTRSEYPLVCKYGSIQIVPVPFI